QDKMIDTYGHAIVETFCGKAKEGEMVPLNRKLLRPQHVGSLMAAVEKHQVARLHLGANQLGPEGWAKVAEYEKGKPQLPKYHVKGTGVQLYAIRRGGRLKQYPAVQFLRGGDLPSHGILSNPNDKPLVTEIQDKMIDTYGHAIVENICGKAKEGEMVHLGQKLLRPQHVGSLMAAVEKHQVAKLDLQSNQLGPEGGAKLAEALKTNASLTSLRCALAALEPMPNARSCGRAPG
ncbi:MAG: hypothetical protein VXW31_09135, partial [Planctomycetota bacterium]|nr:hypothetical protein [Planctomycetota bacterium]